MRLVEYIQAVETGLIPSAAPMGSAPPPQQAHFFDGGERGAVGNNYSRADGQVRRRARAGLPVAAAAQGLGQSAGRGKRSADA